MKIEMKRVLSSLIAVALAVAVAMSLSACGDDDPDDPTPPEKEKTIKSVSLTTSFYVNKAMLDTYDIVATTESGETLNFSTTPVDFNITESQTIEMYAIRCEQTVAKLPVSVSFDLSYTVKDGFELPATSDFAMASTATGVITYTDGTVKNIQSVGFRTINNGVKAENIESYTTLLNRNHSHIEATFDDNKIEF